MNRTTTGGYVFALVATVRPVFAGESDEVK
jgi:hypothetical protein